MARSLCLSLGTLALALLEEASGLGLAVSSTEKAMARSAAAHRLGQGSSSRFWVLPVDKEAIAHVRGQIHTKLVMAQAQAQGVCHGGTEADRVPCRRVLDLLAILIDASTGIEPEWGFLSQVRFMLGLDFWLYNPGPRSCFQMLDTDKDGVISSAEFRHTFARVDKTSFIFEFIDRDQDSAITKEELIDYLRTAVNVRELVPDVDEDSPETTGDALMANIDSILGAAAAPQPHTVPHSPDGDGERLTLVKGICVGALVVILVACYFFCVRDGSDARSEERPPERDSKSAKEESKSSK